MISAANVIEDDIMIYIITRCRNELLFSNYILEAHWSHNGTFFHEEPSPDSPIAPDPNDQHLTL